jgi:hypothetical protein
MCNFCLKPVCVEAITCSVTVFCRFGVAENRVAAYVEATTLTTFSCYHARLHIS